MNQPQPFYRFRAEANDNPASAELLIFSVIGDWEDMGERSAIGFAKELAKLPSSVKRLDIHINSPGGSVSEAMAIYSRLADHRSDKHVYVDGLAASAASLVAMVGHKIYIRANAQMMIHLPMAIAIGNADDMRQTIAALDSHTESMLNVYARRTGLPRDEIRSLMAAETWLHPDAAVEKGFADEVRGVIKAAAIDDKHVMVNGLTFDLSRFHNVPAFSGEQTPTNMKTTAEEKEKTPTPPAHAPAPETKPPDEKPEQPERQPELPRVQPPVQVPAAAQSDYNKGVEAERNRVAALQKLDKPATHDIIVKAITDGKQPHEITGELLDAMEKATQQGDRHEDARILNRIPPSDANPSEQKSFGTLLADKFQARLRKGNLRTVNSRN